MGIAIVVKRRQAHHTQEVQDALFGLGTRRHTMRHQRLANGFPDGQPWVETGIGVLENNLHLTPQWGHRLFVQMGNVATVIDDLPAAGLEKLQNDASCSSFTTTTFPHQAQRLPCIQVE
jgi:hypothetical protein